MRSICLFSARLIDAAEALRIGLVNQVYPHDVFLDKVGEYARDLASGVSPRSTRVIKRQVYEAMFESLGEASEVSQHEMLASRPKVLKEGVAHFLEKRARNFRGK
jgi:enoyl-CoA hydratase/carnithine racemase